MSSKSSILKKRNSIIIGSPTSKLVYVDDHKPLSFKEFLVATNFNIRLLFESRTLQENYIQELLVFNGKPFYFYFLLFRVQKIIITAFEDQDNKDIQTSNIKEMFIIL